VDETTYVVREVGIHEKDKVAGRELEAVAVGRAEAELPLARQDHDLGLAVDLLEILCDLQRAVGAVVLDDDNLEREVTTRQKGMNGRVLGSRGRRETRAHFSRNVFSRSHTMSGRFSRSLYVGSSTEYLGFVMILWSQSWVSQRVRLSGDVYLRATFCRGCCLKCGPQLAEVA
jgi:hypothetical protein